jgi:glutaminyl-tRNA synthetase
MDYIYTRFPPEPNGFIHIGHLKAMTYDFNKHENCRCILRFDDTNPDKENWDFVNGIKEDVEWLGFTPYKITHTSDYFDILYEYAIILIKNGLAYVDFSTPAQISEYRSLQKESTFRNESIEENLEEFEKMKNGIYNEQDCILRLKIDMNHPNAVMRDPLAYRIKKTPHYKTGKKWCIYPSYDFSHGIVDALENIKYSYCTTEFLIRRELYYWPIEQLNKLNSNLNLIPAEVTEFGKLMVENNILSKRNIIKLVDEKVMTGFDDPRLLTIRGLKRRGYTPTILKNIIEFSSMGRSDQTFSNDMIKYHLRKELDENAVRVFGICKPILLKIEGLTNPNQTCLHQNHPKSKETHDTILTDHIYIESTDFREIDDPDFYRLAPGKTIRLRYGPFIQYVSHTAEMIICKVVEPEKPKKVKGIIHWVSADPTYSEKVKFVLYNDILINGILNNNSKEEYIGYIENYASNIKESMQLERVGYFRYDHTNDEKQKVFIRVVELNDSRV